MVSNFNDYNKYINMEEFGGNWFFYIEDMRIPNEDMKGIKPLSKAYSSLLWNQNINNQRHHFAQFSNNERIELFLKKIDYNWQEDWNNGSYENFSNYLNRNIKYNPYDIIIIFWSKECAVETSWRNFLKHWANFLFEDEGVVLMSTINENILLFTSDGMLQMGKRINFR